MENASFKGYKSIFATRLRALIEENNISKQTLSEQIGTSRQAISQYCDGSTIPNADKLTEIAKYFNVSLDYLSGLTDSRTTDTNVRSICDYTGLNEKAVKELHKYLELEKPCKKISEELYGSELTDFCEYIPLYQKFFNHILSSDYLSNEATLFRKLFLLKSDIQFYITSHHNDFNNSKDKHSREEYEEYRDFERDIKASRFELSELFNKIVFDYISEEYTKFTNKYNKIGVDKFNTIIQNRGKNNGNNTETE